MTLYYQVYPLQALYDPSTRAHFRHVTVTGTAITSSSSSSMMMMTHDWDSYNMIPLDIDDDDKDTLYDYDYADITHAFRQTRHSLQSLSLNGISTTSSSWTLYHTTFCSILQGIIGHATLQHLSVLIPSRHSMSRPRRNGIADQTRHTNHNHHNVDIDDYVRRWQLLSTVLHETPSIQSLHLQHSNGVTGLDLLLHTLCHQTTLHRLQLSVEEGFCDESLVAANNNHDTVQRMFRRLDTTLLSMTNLQEFVLDFVPRRHHGRPDPNGHVVSDTVFSRLLHPLACHGTLRQLTLQGLVITNRKATAIANLLRTTRHIQSLTLEHCVFVMVSKTPQQQQTEQRSTSNDVFAAIYQNTSLTDLTVRACRNVAMAYAMYCLQLRDMRIDQLVLEDDCQGPYPSSSCAVKLQRLCLSGNHPARSSSSDSTNTNNDNWLDYLLLGTTTTPTRDVAKACGLLHLDLTGCNLTSQDVVTIANHLWFRRGGTSRSQLQTLTLNCNPLIDDRCLHLLCGVLKNEQVALQALRLQDTTGRHASRFGDKGLESIYSYLVHPNAGLSRLEIDTPYCHGGPEKLFRTLQTNTSLQSLTILSPTDSMALETLRDVLPHNQSLQQLHCRWPHLVHAHDFVMDMMDFDPDDKDEDDDSITNKDTLLSGWMKSLIRNQGLRQVTMIGLPLHCHHIMSYYLQSSHLSQQPTTKRQQQQRQRPVTTASVSTTSLSQQQQHGGSTNVSIGTTTRDDTVVKKKNTTMMVGSSSSSSLTDTSSSSSSTTTTKPLWQDNSDTDDTDSYCDDDELYYYSLPNTRQPPSHKYQALFSSLCPILEASSY